MAIAHDTQTRFPATDGTTGVNSVDTTTGDRTFTHAASASAKAAVVFVFCTGTTAVVTGVLYGGVAMELIADSSDTTEAGRVQGYVLSGSTLPTGSQTITLQGCTATAKWACCSSVTGSDNAILEAFAIKNTTTSANPQVNLTTIRTAQAYAGVHSGAAAPATTGIAGCTIQRSNDYGALCANAVRWTNATAAGTTAIGATIGSDDHCVSAVAFSEFPVYFPSTGIIDDFTRADSGTLGASYTANPLNDGSGDLEVFSNQMRGSGGGDAVWYNVTTYGPDAENYWSIPTAFAASGISEFKLFARVQSPSAASLTADGYCLFYERISAAITVYYERVDNAVETVLGANETVTALAAGNKLGFGVSGSTLQAYRYAGSAWNAYAGGGRTDTTYTTDGYLAVGLYEDVRTALFDDFGGGTTAERAVAPALSLQALHRAGSY